MNNGLVLSGFDLHASLIPTFPLSQLTTSLGFKYHVENIGEVRN